MLQVWRRAPASGFSRQNRIHRTAKYLRMILSMDHYISTSDIHQFGGIYDWNYLRKKWGESLIFSDTELHCFRHGESSLNRNKYVTGSLDVPLTEKGQRQAQELGHKLKKKYDFAYCSNLKRSIETLEIALGSIGIFQVHCIDPRIGEKNLGILEGKPNVFIKAFALGDLDFSPLNGESYRELSQRCMSFLVDLNHLLRTRATMSILISTHMGPMRIFDAIFRGGMKPAEMMALGFSNCSLYSYKIREIPFPSFLDNSLY